MEISFFEMFLLALGGMIGVFIGYAVSVIRIISYLSKYYPDVNFQQSRSERIKEIEEKEEEK
jgi:hypothetical protein